MQTFTFEQINAIAESMPGHHVSEVEHDNFADGYTQPHAIIGKKGFETLPSGKQFPVAVRVEIYKQINKTEYIKVPVEEWKQNGF